MVFSWFIPDRRLLIRDEWIILCRWTGLFALKNNSNKHYQLRDT